jgi:uncharacterized membrane protein
MPPFADGAAWIAAAAVLVAALRGLHWPRLAEPASAAVFGAVLVSLCLLRLAAVPLTPGLELHFSGAAIATLMFGWRYALLALALATLADRLATGAAWIGLPWEFLVGGALPVAGTWWLLAATRKWLPRNPFSYFLAAAFAGGLLSMALAQGARGAIAALAGSDGAGSSLGDYLLSLPAMMFGEGFLTGGALAVLATYRPQWVATFDDDFYLRGGAPPP